MFHTLGIGLQNDHAARKKLHISISKALSSDKVADPWFKGFPSGHTITVFHLLTSDNMSKPESGVCEIEF